MSAFDQARYQVRCEWGLAALQSLAGSEVIIVVDVLSFTTSVDVALGRGAVVLPYRWKDERAAHHAERHGAVLAARRAHTGEGFSLAPSSLETAPKGLRLVLPSPNGSTIAFEAGSRGARVVAGCFRNASAVAAWAGANGECVTLVPAGERWPDESLRPAIEDLGAAGAIARRLGRTLSPEAAAAVAVFEGMADCLLDRLLACGSGRELAEQGFERDVELAAQLDVSRVVPVLENDVFVPAR